MLFTRTNGYSILVDALDQTKQTGAVRLLRQGYQYQPNFTETERVVNGEDEINTVAQLDVKEIGGWTTPLSLDSLQNPSPSMETGRNENIANEIDSATKPKLSKVEGRATSEFGESEENTETNG